MPEDTHSGGSGWKMVDERWRDGAMPFVEKLGFQIERQGQPRMAGRVLGWLLVCEPPWQSVAEMALSLQTSRSAINTIVNRMVDMGVLERVAIPGERSTYFQILQDGGELMFSNMQRNLRGIRELAEEGLQALAWRQDSQNARLAELRDMHAFLEREMPLLLKRFRQQRGREGSP